jgi:methyl-accepting chemotaxis protein
MLDSKNKDKNRFISINVKFSIFIAIAMMVLLIITSIVRIEMLKRNSLNELDKQSDEKINLAALSIENPLWNFDEDGIKKTAEAFLKDKDSDVIYVQIRNTDGKEIYKNETSRANKSELENAGVLLKGLDILAQKDGSKIGNITIKFTKYYMNKSIEHNLISSVLETIIITLIVIGMVVFISNLTMKNLKKLTNTAIELGKGNLKARSNINSNDEVGILSKKFNDMADYINDTIDNLQESNEKVAGNLQNMKNTSAKVAYSAESLASSSEQLAATSQEVSSCMFEVTKVAAQLLNIVNDNTDSTTSVVKKSEKIKKLVLEWEHVINNTIKKFDNIVGAFGIIDTKVSEFNKFSNEIQSIVKAITDISSQTNLLSLNASIEAARAGENGKGFSVVATEIRKLAEGSASSAREIASIVNMIQEKIIESLNAISNGKSEINEGVIIVSSAGKALDVINNEISDSLEFVKGLEANSLESNENIKGVVEQCEVTLKSMEQIVESSADLASLASELNVIALQNK